MKDLFKNIAQGLAVLFFLATPLVWSGVTIDSAGWPKNIFLVAVALGLVLLFSLDLLATRKGVKVFNTPFTLPLILLAIAYLVSTVFSPDWVEAVVLPMGTATVLSLVIIFLLVTGPLWQENRWFMKAGVLAFGLGALLTGGLAFVSFFSQFSFPFKPFTTVGPALGMFPYLATCFLGGAAYFGALWFSPRNHEGLRTKLAVGGVAGICGLLLILNLWNLWPARAQFFTFLPYEAGWQVAAEGLKVSPIWGRGPTNFLTAFTAGRPASLNSDPLLWNVRFFVSSNFPFQLAATVGLLGLGAYLYLLVQIGRVIYKEREKLTAMGWGLAIIVVVGALAQLLLPPMLISWWILLAGLTLFTVHLRSSHPELVETKNTAWPKFAAGAGEALAGFERPFAPDLSRPKARAILSIGVAVVLILLVAGAAYFTVRVSAAEIAYKNGVDAAVANKGNESLGFISEAISLNPMIDTYHLGDSQVQLAMANALASKGKDFSDSDRKMAVKYVQQALQEGKMATETNPLKVTNWENLAALYRSLFNLATGADRFTLAALSQAVTLDPTNPNLRLNQGGTYYALGDFDTAIGFFKQAVALKPDWANAHYNLSAALREKKDYQGAIVEMQKTLDLVPPGSNDYSKASAELDALKQALTGAKQNGGSQSSSETATKSGSERTLEKPSPLPTPAIKPPLKIGSDSGLPASSPTPEPSPSPKP